MLYQAVKCRLINSKKAYIYNSMASMRRENKPILSETEKKRYNRNHQCKCVVEDIKNRKVYIARNDISARSDRVLKGKSCTFFCT